MRAALALNLIPVLSRHQPPRSRPPLPGQTNQQVGSADAPCPPSFNSKSHNPVPIAATVQHALPDSPAARTGQNHAMRLVLELISRGRLSHLPLGSADGAEIANGTVYLSKLKMIMYTSGRWGAPFVAVTDTRGRRISDALCCG